MDMKQRFIVLYALICALIFTSCDPNSPTNPDELSKVITGDVSEITHSSALFSGTINVDVTTYNNLKFGIMLSKTREDLNAGNGEYFEVKKLIGQNFTLEINNLSSTTSYYYCAWLCLNDMQYEFGEIKEFKTLEIPQGKSGIENGHVWKDLGLSVKWATCNVGATQPESLGDFFAWGETRSKNSYTMDSYKYVDINGTPTKYCGSNGFFGCADNKSTHERYDDAASQNWGGSWRMPTKDEIKELIDNCNWEWFSKNGVKGYIVTSKSNNNSIFLPEAGYKKNTTRYAGSNICWSSSVDNSIVEFAWSLAGFGTASTDRSYGMPVRPVCP